MARPMASQGRGLAQLVADLSYLLHLRCHKAGLKPAQWVALRYFSHANLSAATVMGFANHHSMTRGTASRTISHLVRKRLLVSTPNPLDGRSHHLVLSPDARRLLAEDPIEILEGFLGDLPEGEGRQFADVMRQCLVRLLRERS